MSPNEVRSAPGRQFPGRRIQQGRSLIVGLLVVLLLVAACGPATESPAPVAVEPTAGVLDEPTVEKPAVADPIPSQGVEATEEAEAEPAAQATTEPSPQPSPVQAPTDTPTETPTDTPPVVADIAPSVTVIDQEILEGAVIIAEATSPGPGWLVIHAQVDGMPGPVVGYSPLAEGTHADVSVEIDLASATETLHAMLHTDAGELGTWEFPGGPDVPVTLQGQVVAPTFSVTGGLAASEPFVPSVAVTDQAIAGGTVAISEVVSAGPGWVVIHAQADGKPGPILGYSPVADGANSNVVVQVDLSKVTGTLYAMLHEDAGEVGNLEFPEGPDVPAMANGQMISPAFQAQAPAGDEAEVEMEDFQFKPKVLVIRAGTTVKFSNKDDAPHTATSDTGVWDSGYLAKGEEFYFTFTEPGEYPYYCIPHGAPGGQGMAATIVVLQ